MGDEREHDEGDAMEGTGAPGSMVPADHVYTLLLEQVRANNAALDRAHASNVEVQKSLAVAQAELANGTRAFGELRTTLGAIDSRLRAVEIDKVDRATCAGSHAGGKDTTFRVVMALLAGASLVVAVVALARTAYAQTVNGEPPMDPEFLSYLSPFLSAQAIALGLAAAVLAYVLFEVVLKGFVAAVETARPALKRAIVASLAAGLGALGALFVSSDVAIWAGAVAGLVASLPIMAARGLGVAIRTGKGKGGGGLGALGGVLAIALSLSVLSSACVKTTTVRPDGGVVTTETIHPAGLAAIACGALMVEVASTHVQGCLVAPNPEACVLLAAEDTLKVSAPECGAQFGNLLSTKFGDAIRDLVASAIRAIEAGVETRRPGPRLTPTDPGALTAPASTP